MGPDRRERVLASSEYRGIATFYGDQCARRSGFSYMKHIDEGINGLIAIGSSDAALLAWAVHPIFQLDESFHGVMGQPSGLDVCSSKYVLALALEYRATANAFLTDQTSGTPGVSGVDDVNTMLIVDKVQNWKDAREGVYAHLTAEKREHYDWYFSAWLGALGCASAERQTLERAF